MKPPRITRVPIISRVYLVIIGSRLSANPEVDGDDGRRRNPGAEATLR